jgi:glycosyltransferase involved in cell wall biosynthesis
LATVVVQCRGLERATIAALYRRAAATLVTSEAEGFGLPLIEALACGSIVVASDLAVLREVGGAACIYCPVADVDAWSATVGRMLNDPRRAPERAIRLERAGCYSWGNHTRIVFDTYRRLLT